MTDVTTTVTNTGILRQFTTPIPPGEEAFAEILYGGDFSIPAKLAADENRAVIQCIMPRNFFYRVVSMNIFVRAENLISVDDLGKAWLVIITENNVNARLFPLYNMSRPFANTGSTGAVEMNFTSVTNEVATWFGTIVPLDPGLVNASQGISILQMEIFDVSADSTSIFSVTFRVVVKQYTIEQAEKALLNSPVLVT